MQVHCRRHGPLVGHQRCQGDPEIAGEGARKPQHFRADGGQSVFCCLREGPHADGPVVLQLHQRKVLGLLVCQSRPQVLIAVPQRPG